MRVDLQLILVFVNDPNLFYKIGLVLYQKINFMDHSDDQSDLLPDDDLLMQQEIMLLRIKAYENSTTFTEEQFQQEEKEIRKKYAYRSDDY